MPVELSNPSDVTSFLASISDAAKAVLGRVVLFVPHCQMFMLLPCDLQYIENRLT